MVARWLIGVNDKNIFWSFNMCGTPLNVHIFWSEKNPKTVIPKVVLQ